MHSAKLRKLLGLGASTLLLVSNGAWAGQVLDYTIRWSTADDRYHVYMKPSETPALDRSMTAQVTIVVPHAEDNESFQVNALSSRVQGISWSQNSRANKPVENPNADYLSFTLTASNAAAFAWQSGEEVEVFSFSNNGACLGPVSLLNNNTDPFILPVNNGGSNSAKTNPGNQFSNLGWSEFAGENNYRTNYGDPADCRDSLDDDGDGVPNGDDPGPNNPDDDGDGIPTKDENYNGGSPLDDDTDQDGIPDFMDTDDDGDGIQTKAENYNGGTAADDDTDNDNTPDYLDVDDDGDSILTQDENYNFGSPENDDTDRDNTPDYLDSDDDNDGVLTRLENYNGGTPEDDDTDGDNTPDYLDTDDDGDGKPSAAESNDPNNDGKPDDALDTDGDGTPDYLDLNDSDGPKGDPDDDGLTNEEEEELGSDPNNADDDGDGIPTKEENYNGGSPADDDTDRDGIPDFMDPDDDNDGVLTKNENHDGDATPKNDDTDNDKTPDYLDTDDDGDGVLTANENYNGGTPEDDDTDNDKIPDYLDTDDDGDGTPSAEENNDLNKDGKPDDATDTDGDGTPDYLDVTDDMAALQVRVMLQGAFDGTTGLMADDLRTSGLIPATQPYSDAVFAYTGTERMTASLLQTVGNNALVDWVLVELRDKANNEIIKARQAALVERDGDVVDAVTGSKTLQFAGVDPGDYFVSIRHRNHLGAMTAGLVNIQAIAPLVDFASTQTLTYGTNARTAYQNIALLWAGNADSNKSLIANGPGQDSAILIGNVLIDAGNTSFSTNYVLEGYSNNDLNLDGETIVAGPGNDLNLLVGNILLHPDNYTFSANFIVPERLP